MSITIPSSKIVISNKRQNSLLLPGNDPINDDIFIIRTNCKGSNMYATTNCVPYRSYTQDGRELLGGECNWCGLKYKHARIGIIKAFLQDETTENKFIVYWEGDSCGFRCMYAEADLWAGDHTYGDEYSDAVTNIKQLFEKCYPGKTLIKSPPYFLFKTKGGSIDPEKYERYAYIPQNDVITVPIKRVFELKKLPDSDPPGSPNTPLNKNSEKPESQKENNLKKLSHRHKKVISEVED